MVRVMFSLTLLVASQLAFSQTTEVTSQPETSQVVPAGLIQLSQESYFSPYALIVDKQARKLSIWQKSDEGLKKVAEYPTDIGKKDGDKFRGGDHKTPEGIYFLTERLNGNAIDFNLYGSMAFTTDYPNFFDKRLGKTGSGIWLHAIPDTVALTRGSRGCVVVRDQVIKQIANYVKIGQTPILIYDQVEWTKQSESQEMRKKVLSFIDTWRNEWEHQNIDNYMTNYDESFTSLGMNWEQWKKFKTGLKDKYTFVKVQLSDPIVVTHRDEIIIKTLQHYTSDKHSDFGEKTIYLRNTPQGFKIVGEEWQKADEQKTAQN